MFSLRNLGAPTGILAALALLLCFAQPAAAGMVATDEVLRGSDDRREAVVQALERDAVAAELEAMGVSVESARQRVQRMTDTEVARLHGHIAALPAGGDLSTVELLLIIIIVILLV
ncbi:MAG: PA2779 family protein [Halofilum sp. (in: g-proteobacteria)]|nr:PA2779 family protein [Halofilum sp. (in: g-proteobacteria)]